MNSKRVKAGASLLCISLWLLTVAPVSQAMKNKPYLQTIEQVVVTATRNPFSNYASTSHATSSIVTEDSLRQSTNLMDMIRTETGVAENGQPGLFQVPSIRGVSRQRVMTLIDGIRLTSERRAGNAASFIDPLLLQQVDILRGPSSTLYGSGALGGVIQLIPVTVTGTQGQLGYQSAGDEVVVQAGWGNDQWSVAGAKRTANNSEDIDGNELNTGFSQWSAVLKWQGQWQDTQLSLMWLPARGTDIGRSNARFPERVVNVPEESHDLLSMSVISDDGWTGKIYVHDQQLTTKTLRPANRINEVSNKSVDFGGSIQQSLSAFSAETLLGIDYFARRHVDSNEREYRFDTQEAQIKTTLNNATKDELALYGTWVKQWHSSRLQLGARYTYQRDNNDNVDKNTDNRTTGFAGWNVTLGDYWELAINTGSGFRFPSLTEKYFTGTTGRGFVVGNPQLQPESAINIDASIRRQNTDSMFQLIFFRNRISNYIERELIAPEQLTFKNTTQGNIEGAELELSRQLTPAWSMQFSAVTVKGENNQGAPLADIPAERLTLRNTYSTKSDLFTIDWQHRRKKHTIGTGEIPTPSANLLSASWRHFLSTELTLTLSIDNILDDTYFSSADDLSTLSPGRQVGIHFSWRHL